MTTRRAEDARLARYCKSESAEILAVIVTRRIQQEEPRTRAPGM
jgi:hypothetical protein